MAETAKKDEEVPHYLHFHHYWPQLESGSGSSFVSNGLKEPVGSSLLTVQTPSGCDQAGSLLHSLYTQSRQRTSAGHEMVVLSSSRSLRCPSAQWELIPSDTVHWEPGVQAASLGI